MTEIDIDSVWPRTEEYRFRLYAVVGDERDVLAAAADMEGIGCAIATLHDDQKLIGRRLDDLGRIGILDVMPGGNPAPAGEWIVTPYDRGRS